MRKFYLLYKGRISQPVVGKSSRAKKSQPVVGKLGGPLQLSWSHYIQLLKIQDENERNFYEIEAIQNNWGKRELIRQYDSSLYERIALSKNKKAVKQLGEKGQIIEKPTDAIKDHTVLEFLDLKEDETYSESDLENAIISKLGHLMMELGKGFLFEGRQKRFTFEGDSFFVDLVFYKRDIGRESFSYGESFRSYGSINLKSIDFTVLYVINRFVSKGSSDASNIANFILYEFIWLTKFL